jgi:hypothetical protein
MNSSVEVMTPAVCMFHFPNHLVHFGEMSYPCFLLKVLLGHINQSTIIPTSCEAQIEHYEISQKMAYHSRNMRIYEGVSKSFWTSRLEQELEIVQLSARCSCITIL